MAAVSLGECSICCGALLDQRGRVPLVLKECGHTFCETCVGTIRSGKNECFACRRPFAGAVTNFALLGGAPAQVQSSLVQLASRAAEPSCKPAAATIAELPVRPLTPSIQDRLNGVVSLCESGHKEEAERVLKEILAIPNMSERDKARATYDLGVIYVFTDRCKEAVELLLPLQYCGEFRRVQGNLALAMAYRGLGQYEASRVLIEELLKGCAGSMNDVHEEHIRLCKAEKRMAMAQSSLDYLIEKSTGRYRRFALCEQALWYQSFPSHVASANRCWERLIGDPETKEAGRCLAIYHLAKNQAAEGQLSEAIGRLIPLVDIPLVKERVDARILLGTIYRAQKKYPEAIRVLQSVFIPDSGGSVSQQIDARLELVETYYQSGHEGSRRAADELRDNVLRDEESTAEQKKRARALGPSLCVIQ